MSGITEGHASRSFESWVNSEMPNASLERDANGEYKSEVVSAMFVAFCAGMITAGVDIDWAKG